MCYRWNGLELHRLHAHSGFLGNTRCNWNVHFTWKRHSRFSYAVRFPVLTSIVEREFNTEIPRIACQGWLFSIVYMESAANSNDTSATNCWNYVLGTPVYHWGIPNVRLVTRSRALLSKLNTGKWMAHKLLPCHITRFHQCTKSSKCHTRVKPWCECEAVLCWKVENLLFFLKWHLQNIVDCEESLGFVWYNVISFFCVHVERNKCDIFFSGTPSVHAHATISIIKHESQILNLNQHGKGHGAWRYWKLCLSVL